MQVGRLLAGRGVGRRAEAVEELGDLDRRVALGALEQQVLEEVRDARLRRRLVARAGPHPEPERDRAHRGNLLGDDPDARVELGAARRPRAGRVTARALAAGASRPRAAAASAARPPLAVATAAATAVAAVAAAAAAAASSGRRCRRSLQLLGRLARDRRVVGEAQADPAALAVDLDHGDVDLVARREHVLDRVDPLAGLHVRDVQQAVGALDQLDEGAEGGRLDDLGLR